MAHSLLNHPKADEWLPWFAQTVASGQDVAPEVGADLVLKLASGHYDSLSGCFLHITDDLDALVQRADEIRRERAYSLRLKKI